MNETEIMGIEEELATVLAMIYRRIDWSKISTKSAHLFYQSNIRASMNVVNFKQFLDKLCKKVGVQFIKLDSDLIRKLNNESLVMSLIREETVYIMNYALDIAEEMKNEDKRGLKGADY